MSSTTYDAATGIILGTFKRGVLPTENQADPSAMQIALQHLPLNGPFECSYTVFNLISDLSAPAPHEVYQPVQVVSPLNYFFLHWN